MIAHESATDSPRSRSTSKPIVIKRGSVKVSIYRSERTEAGKSYERFTLVYRELSGGRVRRNFADLETAKVEADKIATRLANGQTDVMALSNGDVAELVKARQVLAPYKLSVGTVAAEYAMLLGRLPSGATVLEAVEFFAKRHPANAPRKTVSEVVVEFIQDRTNAGCSGHHLRDLGIRLKRFGDAFQMPMASVEPAQVREFIQSLKNEKTKKVARNRSKENILRMVKSVFTYARKQRYIPRDLEDEISDIEPPQTEPSKIGIFTPDEIARILACADDELIPAIAIGAFAGLRLAEVSRIDWKDVRASEGFLVVDAKNAKTRARRIVPLSENLCRWLAGRRRAQGPVNPAPDDNALGDRIERAAAKAKVPWKRNGLRHSYISYRVALTKNVAQTALECGNSPAIIFSNYRELVREDDAKQWFAVAPVPDASSATILPLSEKVAA